METFLHAGSADLYAGTVRNPCPLEVWVLAAVSAWVELGSTNGVGVLSNNFRAFCAERTDVCHRICINRHILPYNKAFRKPRESFFAILFRMLEAANISQIVFPFLVVIFSIILHEVAHGYAAYIQGDETAYRAGRLTLNPLPHIDMMGSVIVPLLALFGFGMLFGWAKPVPYNVYNIRTRIGHAFVAAAGVLTNILVAALAILAFKLLSIQGLITSGMAEAILIIVMVNVSLAFFNLIPVPPFDGMAIIQAFFPRLHINSALIYNPLYLIGAILLASVLYTRFIPYIYAWVSALLR